MTATGGSRPAVVFTFPPRFTGVDHGPFGPLRVDVQMSWPPSPPVRLDANTTSRPSRRTFGWMSVAELFSSVTGSGGPKLPLPWRSLR